MSWASLERQKVKMTAQLEDDQPLINIEPDTEDDGDVALLGEQRTEGDGTNEVNDQRNNPQPPVQGEEDPLVDLGPRGQKRDRDGCAQCCKSCMVSCCHQCTTIDYVIAVDNVLLVAVGFAEAVLACLSKMRTHSQCYLKAEYHSNGNTDYTDEMYWCDANLYDTLVTMSIAYLLIMVNWTAQLNENTWWMRIKLFLNVAGWTGKLVSGILLLVAFFSWCSSMEAAVSSHHFANADNKCLAAARFFDANKDEENTLAHLYVFTLASLSLALLCTILWTVALICTIIHFFDFIYRKKEQHEDRDEDEYHMDDGDDDNVNYRYPEYIPENYVRHRIVGAGGAADGGAVVDTAGNIQDGDPDAAYVLEPRGLPA